MRMILIEEKNRVEERHIGERRERRKSRITKVSLWPTYAHTPPQAIKCKDQIILAYEKWSCRRPFFILLLECLPADGKSQHEE